MIEDRVLIYRFKRGDGGALRRIYEKYRGYLLTLAMGLLGDGGEAEDVVHDFFVRFAESGRSMRTEGSLKWYLAKCVANRARDKMRARKRQAVGLDAAAEVEGQQETAEARAMGNEEMELLKGALEQLPYEQREVVVLYGRGEMRFRAIAKLQEVSIKTVQSRYRYGIEKLRAILDGQVTE